MTREQLQSLLDSEQFSGHGREAELVETHISWVILSEKHAFKLKKPVKFDFLDFSTLEKRKYYCERELELNSRLTEGVYKEVLPVVDSEGGLRIGGEGKTVDYALKMKRLDSSRQMNLLLEEGAVTAHHMKQLAEQLAAFHLHTDVISQSPSIQEMKENFAALDSVRDPLRKLLGEDVGELLTKSIYFAGELLDSCKAQLLRRSRHGYIVDGHGDLHSRNIFLLDEPVIFDCIEFNDAFRQVDVLDELAFLCMDLDYYSSRELERPLLRTYLKENPCILDDTDWCIFNYYRWYRANVKLKVSVLKAEQEGGSADSSDVEEYWRLYSTYYHILKRGQSLAPDELKKP